MTSLKEYFHTDWAAMTTQDWIGLVLTVAIFLFMVWAYVHVFHPKNKAKFDARQNLMPDADDAKIDTENRDER